MSNTKNLFQSFSNLAIPVAKAPSTQSASPEKPPRTYRTLAYLDIMITILISFTSSGIIVRDYFEE